MNAALSVEAPVLQAGIPEGFCGGRKREDFPHLLPPGVLSQPEEGWALEPPPLL